MRTVCGPELNRPRAVYSRKYGKFSQSAIVNNIIFNLLKVGFLYEKNVSTALCRVVE